MDSNKEKAMSSWNPRKTKILSVTVAAVALCCWAAPRILEGASPDNSTNVTYTAQGNFASTPVSGNDTLKLAGEPFQITVVGSSSLKPIKHGRNWANFKPLNMTGTVYSGLVPGTPIPISATTAAINQTVGASEDIFQSGFPVTVIGIGLTVRSYITMPGGTLTNDLVRPFPSVTLNPSNATITYSDTTNSTVLAVQNGTLVATIP